MSLAWSDFARALADEPLPVALVDLDALERNVDRLRAQVRGTGKTLRVASKSVRHVGLLRRVLERGGDDFRGLMCFTPREAAFLATEGFDDLLVAYPSTRGLAEVAAQVRDGKTIRLMADGEAHLEAYQRAAEAAGVTLEVLLELDVAYQPMGGRLHLGVLRSPLRTAARIEAVAREAQRHGSLRVVGLMGYEAHVAGLPDATPFSRALNPARRALKRLSVPQIAQLRADAVEALRRAGVDPVVVNGGGTGSLSTTTSEAAVTEVTAGSGFLCSHLFDYYVGNVLEPAAFFALEVCREPEAGVVTCLGGGYVASGEPGWDRLPLPWLPRGLQYISIEGAGEVQTPLRVPSGVRLAVGDPVIFRHAKAGELAERFDAYALMSGGRIVAREPTYRGQGACFL
ncbi:MAG: alanine racemase [Sandaracinaceae bacterium]|nr:alanine racemase [Sandaracinaceae bacterium]